MLAKVLEVIASKLPSPRIIYDRAGKSPYLSRWYLYGRPTMPDGSHPFDEVGAPRPGILDPDRPFAVFLHKFHRGDDDLELHNHPWTWSIAFVLSGGYREEYRRGAPEEGGCVFVREVRPPFVNIIRHDTFHRVELLDKTAWSIFVAGPREKDWGFWNRVTGVYTQWRAFINRKRDPTAFAQDDARMGRHLGRDNTFYANSPGGFMAGAVARAGGQALAKLVSQEREHCVGNETLVEVDVYSVQCAFTRTGGDCQTCEEREKRAEVGDAAAHKGLIDNYRYEPS